MSELQVHRAAIAPQLMLAELGRVCFELILCVVILVLALAKCTPKPNEPNDPEDHFFTCARTPRYFITGHAITSRVARVAALVVERSIARAMQATAQVSRNRVLAGTSTVIIKYSIV